MATEVANNEASVEARIDSRASAFTGSLMKNIGPAMKWAGKVLMAVARFLAKVFNRIVLGFFPLTHRKQDYRWTDFLQYFPSLLIVSVWFFLPILVPTFLPSMDHRYYWIGDFYLIYMVFVYAVETSMDREHSLLFELLVPLAGLAWYGIEYGFIGQPVLGGGLGAFIPAVLFVLLTQLVDFRARRSMSQDGNAVEEKHENVRDNDE